MTVSATDSLPTTSTASTIAVDCVIIGAGASGLQCAADLLSWESSLKSPSSSPSLVVLEARSRNGGRIHTVTEHVPLVNVENEVDGKTGQEVAETTTFHRDLGAAWVHGIGNVEETKERIIEEEEHADRDDSNSDSTSRVSSSINPMVELLLKNHASTTTGHDIDDIDIQNVPLYDYDDNSSSKNVEDPTTTTTTTTLVLSEPLLTILDPIFCGNPETRPRTVLLGMNSNNEEEDGGKGTGNDDDNDDDSNPIPSSKMMALAMYVDGKHVTNQQLLLRGINRHYQILQHAETNYRRTMVTAPFQDVNKDDDDDDENENGQIVVRPELISVEDAVNTVDRTTTQLDNDKHSDVDDPTVLMVVDTLSNFFRYILTNWHGISLSKMQFDALVLPINSKEEFWGDGDYNGPHCKSRDGGMESILQPLIRQIEQNGQVDKNDHNNCTSIQCNKEVIQIVDDPQNQVVRVITACGMTYEAKCCVCTIPLGCLQHHTRRTTTTTETTTTPTQPSSSSSSSSIPSSYFIPPLDPIKVNAIHSIWSGSYKKVFMTFNRIFWPVHPPAIGLSLTSPSSHSLPSVSKMKEHDPDDNDDNNDNTNTNNSNKCPNLQFPTNHLLLTNVWAKHAIPCLEATLCGDVGVWACHQSDDDIGHAVLQFMAQTMNVPSLMMIPRSKTKMMIDGHCTSDDNNDNTDDDLHNAGPSSPDKQPPPPPPQPSCLSVTVTRWEEDPFTRGSYSTYQLGTLDDHIDEIQRSTWNGRLIFAGEHTESDHMGSVHGALLSGKRAANEVRHKMNTT